MLVRPHLLLTQPFPAGRRLPLDIAPGAAAAYSLRKLSSAYAGKAVNIRRSSDSAAQDIGFIGNDFDLASFNTFVGGGSGFVTTWYDQSGNVNNAAQATAGSQPQLITSVAALGTRPGIRFGDNLGMGLFASAAVSVNDVFAAGGTVSLVANIVAPAAGNDRIATKGAAGGAWIFNFNGAATQLQFQQLAGTTNGAWTTSALTVGGHVVDVQYSYASLANKPTFGVDGNAQSPAGTQPVGTIASDAGSSFIVGYNGGSAGGYPAEMGEFLSYKSSLSLTGLRANQKAYWGTP